MSPELTATSLLAATTETLDAAGYNRAEQPDEWTIEASDLYEDPYGVVAVIVYETWAELSGQWLDAQAMLVNILGKHFVRSDAKTWEGYLVLLTPGVVPLDDRLEAAELRRNTQHVRKLLATGEELRGLADVQDALLPLLPLSPPKELVESGTALDMLPGLLEKREIRRQDVEAVIEAFAEQESVIERLHRERETNGDNG